MRRCSTHVSGHKGGIAGVYNRASYAAEKAQALAPVGMGVLRPLLMGSAAASPRCGGDDERPHREAGRDHYKGALGRAGFCSGSPMLPIVRERYRELKGALPLYLEHNCECDPKSLEKAAVFFGLDHLEAADCIILLRTLAAVNFPTRKRGRKKGANTSWNDYRLCLLGRRYRELKAQNPTHSDTKIAELISKDEEFKEFRRGSYEPIRKRLRAGEKSFGVA